MPNRSCDVLIVGGGIGGVAAALSACSLGMNVVLTEETDWIGGQLTAQAVPPDEHPWIEEFGCTARYREFRNRVRDWYRKNGGLNAETLSDPFFNPGTGWVSRLCHEPEVALSVLLEMAAPHMHSGQLEILLKRKPKAAEVLGDCVNAVSFLNLETGQTEEIGFKVVLDATELGDLLLLTGTEYNLGAESQRDTGEPNALEGDPDPNNVQGLTWVFAMGLGASSPPQKPEDYEFWRAYRPDFWPGPLLGFDVLHAHTQEPRRLPLFSEDWYALFPYRQIINPTVLNLERDPVTVVNWPQNDYFLQSIIDVEPYEPHPMPGASGPISAQRLQDARMLSSGLLYWLQTEAPRNDGGLGYPECYAASGITGTPDGFAKYPYIRESRRIKAQFTILEQHVAAYTNPGLDRAPGFADSVGIGAYRIDLHPSTSGANMIDTSTLPFEIPLRAMIPIRMQNLIPAGKNIGTTHITNGCYRLHPVEWNIGEIAGIMAALIIEKDIPVQALGKNPDVVQSEAVTQGIPLSWPAGATLWAL
ncbi:MAG: FAD-dependent oxidoreductase [Fimbriimonadaceae bacterium]